MSLTSRQKLILWSAGSFICIVLILFVVILGSISHGRTPPPTPVEKNELDGQVFRYTLRLPIPTTMKSKIQATCFMENSAAQPLNTTATATPCPPVVMSMISLENQALANWTPNKRSNASTKSTSFLFTAGSIKFEEETIQADYLLSFVDIAPERVKDLIKRGKEEKNSKFFNFTHCTLSLDSDPEEDPECKRFRSMNDITSPNIHEFHRETSIFGVDKLDLESKMRRAAEFPGDLEVVQSVRTLKEGWTLKTFSAKLIAYEEKRKIICDCLNHFESIKDKDFSGICMQIFGVWKEFQPFLMKDEKVCFPEPQFKGI